MGQEAEAADDITVGVQNYRIRHHAGSSPERRSSTDHDDSCVVLVDIRELNRPETSLLKASDAVDSNDELTGNLRHLSIGDSIGLHGGHAESVAVLDHLRIADGQCRSQICQI